MADGVVFRVAYDQDIVNSFLVFELMQRVVFVIADFRENERLFAENFFLIIPIIDDLD